MKDILNQLFEHQELSHDQAREVLINISHERYNSAQVSAFISVYLMRNISVQELSGFREALHSLCIPFEGWEGESIDLCGTGGDSKNTFNISTIASFVVAAAGYKVTKHGNYGVSSISGSSNVLECAGVQFNNNSDKLMRQLDKCNICFLHAPLFHPALKSVGPIRKALGVKTFFNMLGPLVNPARPKYQLTGVFSLKLLRLYQYLLQQSDCQYTLVHSLDGYDEVSLTGPVKIITNNSECIAHPVYFGLDRLSTDDITAGHSIDDALKIFSAILNNQGTKAQNDVVLANAAIAIQTIHPHKDIMTALDEAKAALYSGAALQTFKTFLKYQ